MALICSFGLLDTRKLFWVSLTEIGKTQLAPMAKVNEVMTDDLIWEAASSTQNAQVFEAINPLGTWTLSVKEDEAERIVIALTCLLNKPPKQPRLVPLGIEQIAVDHLLYQGRFMGGCSSHLLPGRESRIFQSVFLISLTPGGTMLQLSRPLAQEHLSEFSGRIKGGKICNLEAVTTFDSCCGEVFHSTEVTLATSNDGHGLVDGSSGER